jgi:signal transduction histidine kinase
MVWANAAGLRFWGAATLDELLARDFASLSEATVTRNEAVMGEHAAGRTVRETWTLYPRGQPLTVTTHSTGVTLPDGRPAILYEAEAALPELDPAVIRGVEALQHTSVRVALHRPGGAVVLRNPAAVRAWGLGGGDHADDFAAMFEEPTVAEAARAVVAAGGTWSAEVVLRTVEGPRWHGLDARPVLDPVTGAPLVQINARDISDLKAEQAASARARDLAEAANRAKSEFLANMSHEIRTPLNGVLGMLELVLDSPLTAEQAEFLGLARLSAESLLGVINDVLDFSKIEAGVLEVERCEFSPHQLLDEALPAFALQGRRAGLTVTGSLDPEVPLLLVGDPARIRQVLVNLVGNAVKFTPAGSVEVRVSVAPGPPERLLFAVHDTGIGVAPEQRERIFSAFVQADGSTTRRFGGTGLGLAISQRLAGLLGGRITLESEVGRGSSFVLDVPLVRAAAAGAEG